ncbi:dimethylaniline monooxygenase [Streptomyces albus]|uniref:Dimethylaniline monooxygenase n=1 Tax=Streptomyces albus (strain ATCC 21838 / DSM 41398 / FERM P-419 / JCM 4703 / NBRC 107858) TaxID=1081613 RepID=A0A0B5EZJ0_STRA4|nr:dimethylaniline monooxygenase [Streptomyces albus]AOU77781.1 dimethylaniline monooxygenase [Streptomyces albus]AYN33542.1 dimethylaniline monooxygenase [Streptomyces albus]
MLTHDLLVVGAGPYGLSIAAHAAAAGLDLKVFGRPMDSWRSHMPPGMLLKSEPWASHLSDPAGAFGLDAYAAAHGLSARHGEPIGVAEFAAYGMWFAERAVPAVDERLVRSLRPVPGGFRATTEDGEEVRARTVALAVGVLPFVDLPGALRPLGTDGALASHSSHHGDLTRFRGQDVTVVGGGQAALETAALLAEQGTRTRVLTRAGQLCWNDLPPALDRPWWRRARSPLSGLGQGWRNWSYSELPGAFRLLPAERRTRISATALGPAGAWWVRSRVESGVEVLTGHEIIRAEPAGGRVGLEVAGPGGTLRLRTDHVLAATGFTASSARLAPLDPEIRAALRTLGDGSPATGPGFESSCPGLFLAGLVTASAFGPSMRFVYGASYTADRLVRGVRRRLRRGGPVRVPGPAVEVEAGAVGSRAIEAGAVGSGAIEAGAAGVSAAGASAAGADDGRSPAGAGAAG